MQTRTLTINTEGRGLYNITDAVQRFVPQATGLLNVFIKHTSASLIICENSDPDVLRDLENFAQHWVPDGAKEYTHTAEGPDDMPAHIRSVFSHTTLSIPFVDGRLCLGAWQGIFVWEHRLAGHTRQVICSAL